MMAQPGNVNTYLPLTFNGTFYISIIILYMNTYIVLGFVFLFIKNESRIETKLITWDLLIFIYKTTLWNYKRIKTKNDSSI
jgi:hypothetical protein